MNETALVQTVPGQQFVGLSVSSNPGNKANLFAILCWIDTNSAQCIEIGFDRVPTFVTGARIEM